MGTMDILGFSFQKGRVRHTTLKKDKTELKYARHGQVKYDPALDLTDLVERWHLDFEELLKSEKPHIVAACEIIESTGRDSSRFQIMPLAILSYSCKNLNIKLITFSPQAFVHPGPFGLAKGTKPKEQVDTIFGNHPPYWDEMQKKSVLAAWRASHAI